LYEPNTCAKRVNVHEICNVHYVWILHVHVMWNIATCGHSLPP